MLRSGECFRNLLFILLMYYIFKPGSAYENILMDYLDTNYVYLNRSSNISNYLSKLSPYEDESSSQFKYFNFEENMFFRNYSTKETMPLVEDSSLYEFIEKILFCKLKKNGYFLIF